MEVFTNSACEDVASDDPSVVIPERAPGDPALSDDPGRMLNGCRQYLLMIANEVIGPEVQAKVGASDLVQDTFLEAQRHLSLFRGKTDAEMRAWLRKILECRLANIRRAFLVRKKRAAGHEVPLKASGDGPGMAIETLQSRVPSPSNHAVRNELNAGLEQALSRLADHYRQAVALRHVEQLSWEEIGRRMGGTAEAARKVWGRAIQQLRRELADHEPMP